MQTGLTRSEQLALVGLVVVLLGGLAIHGRRALPTPDSAPEGVWIEAPAEWQAAELSEPPHAAPPAAAPPVLSLAEPPGTSPDPVSGIASAAGLPVSPRAAEPSAANPALIDVNSAGAAELDRLPGIGPAKAEAILTTRDALGGFRQAEDLLEVPGIGPATLERLRPYVRFGASAPAPASPAAGPASALAVSEAPRAPASSPKLININTASSAELQAIPGIGPVLAERIVTHRGRGPFRRPEDLMAVRGIGPKTYQKMKPYIAVAP